MSAEMTETLQLIFQIIQWVGSLCGFIGLIILIVRFVKERPILKIEFLSAHDVSEDEENTLFQISLDIDNVGDKPTTIKEIYFRIPDKKEKDSWFISEFEDFKMFHLSPRSSKVFSEVVIMDGYFEEDIEIEVTVDHTHGHVDMKIESIFIPGIFDIENNDYGEC